MNSKDRASLNRDAQFLTASLRFVWHMLMWAVFLLLSPFLLGLVMVSGVHLMSPDEVALTKILLVVLGPFGFVFWWIIIRRASDQHRARRLIARRSNTGEDYSDAELRFLEGVGKPRHISNFVVLIISLAGSSYAATLFYRAGDKQCFIAVLAGIFSPAIIVGAYKALFGF